MSYFNSLLLFFVYVGMHISFKVFPCLNIYCLFEFQYKLTFQQPSANPKIPTGSKYCMVGEVVAITIEQWYTRMLN